MYYSCYRVVDPILGALEVSLKFGPEIEVGPVKAGGSFYKNLATGGTGAVLELNAALVGSQVKNETPKGGSFGGGSEGPQYSVSLFGFQYDFRTRQVSFAPAKSIKVGLQALIGVEVSFNSDTFKRVALMNDVCRAQGAK
jgi:hypothetical protein